MKVKVGGQWYVSAPGQPIMVHLEPLDRENIRDMPAEFRRYACFHEHEPMAVPAREAWMREEG